MIKSYLITGGAGFIGSNFIHYLLKKYSDIKIINLDKLTYAGNLDNLSSIRNDNRYSFIQGDICDKSTVQNIFQSFSIDYIVNFAAETHVDRSILDPEIFAYTNIQGTVNLLNCAKKAWQIGDDIYKPGVKFLQISTDEVYGSIKKDEPPFTEESPLNPSNPYSSSKASADLIALSYHKTYQLPLNITRSSNNYGPHQFPEKLIPLAIQNILQNKKVPIYGDGKQIRDWLYVEDNCNAIDLVLHKGVVGEIYNISGNNEYDNLYVVKIILKLLIKKQKTSLTYSLIQHIDDRKNHDRHYALNSNKIQRQLDWKCKTTFCKGLNFTLNWYLQNQRFSFNDK